MRYAKGDVVKKYFLSLFFLDIFCLSAMEKSPSDEQEILKTSSHELSKDEPELIAIEETHSKSEELLRKKVRQLKLELKKTREECDTCKECAEEIEKKYCMLLEFVYGFDEQRSPGLRLMSHAVLRSDSPRLSYAIKILNQLHEAFE